jgi:RND family efflux transporter MFP subunit
MNMFTTVTPVDGEPLALKERFKMRPLWQRTGLVAGPILALAAGVTLLDGDNEAAAAPPPPMVTVAAPLEQDINQWDDYVGRFEASRSVEVRPRVSGAITAVHFTDGAIVRQGQLLFTIDPRPFAAALAEARAGVATAASDLALAETNLGRARRLLAEEAVSRSDFDRLAAAAQSARAALAAAQARVHGRALDMEFTRVRAPISGRISDRRIDAGNLVTAGDGAGTLLTTINALDPIYFTFDVPESLFLKTAREQQSNGRAAQTAEIRLQDEAGYHWRGRLDFTDNGINQTSGTIRARVVVPNPTYFLAPGMFGNMRLSDGGTTPALLIPDAAVRTDQARKIVLVVGKDDTVVAKPVEPGPLVGGLRAIRSGISRNDRVVIQGVQFAQPGATVRPRVTRIALKQAATITPITPISASAPSASQATIVGN